MSRGHGQLGLLDRLKTFADLAGAGTEVSRRPYLECRLGLSLQGWAASGSNWTRTVTAAELTQMGVIPAIVGCESLIHPRPLVRVERTADLVAGTWFWDDAALVAGGSATLTVRLPTATDPDDATAGLVVHLLFCFGGGDISGNAETHPLLGANKFLNEGFETWGGGNPTSWTEVGAGAVQETSVVLDGLSSAKIGSAAIGAGALDGVQQSHVGIQGGLYRVAGYYQTPLTGQSAEVEARLRVGVASSWLTSDGMGTTAVDGGFRIGDTQGETRRFLFDFVHSGASTASLPAGIFLKNTAGGARAGLLYVDRMSFRRIHRFNLYLPNLSASSIPEMSIQSQSILFGAKTIGFGSVTLIDGDGEIAKALASLLVLQKPAQVYVGGSWPNGDEIHRDDWRGVFPALIRKAEVSPGEVTLELENAQGLAKAEAAERAHRLADQATMSRSQEGLIKPLVFGTPFETGGATFQHIIPGVRVATNATTGYGEYEFLDPYVPVRDGVDVDLPASYSIKVFPNKDLADRNLQGRIITDSTNDFDVTNNKTRWRVKRDIRDMRYDRAGTDVGTNATFPFGIAGPAGAVLYATFNVAGPPYLNAANLETSMNAAAGVADITVVYSESTHQFTTAKGAGTLDLFMTSKNTDRAHVQSWKLFGYDTSADKTGSLSYLADEALFEEIDAHHVIRFPGGGYRDDSAGSICGVANVAIDNWPAIVSWLLQKRLRIPAALIDIPSFSAARTASRDTDFAIVFGTFDEVNVEELMAIAEKVTVSSIVPDGEGVWHYIRHEAGTAGARVFYDEDYIAGSWRMWTDPMAIYREVRVHGDWNPSQKRFMTHGDGLGVLDPYIPIKYGDERVLEIPSYVERQYLTGGTNQTGNYYARLIGAAPRVVTFESTSKLVDLLPGHKVILNHSGPGVLDPTGALSSVAFRIVDVVKRLATTGITRCVAVEDVPFLS